MIPYIPYHDLIHSLVHLWPSFFAFVYSFGGILVQWILHHNTFNRLARTSRPFMYANGFLLLTIVFFPFPTALLAEYINTPYAMPAIVFYGVASIINSWGWYFFARTVQKPVPLLKESVPIEAFGKLIKGNYYGRIIYFSTTVMAIWFPYTALALNVAVWILWIWLSLIEKDEIS